MYRPVVRERWEEWLQRCVHEHMPPDFPYRYWGLGFHNCRFGYRTIDIVEEVVANYSAAMVGALQLVTGSYSAVYCKELLKW